MKMKEAAYLYNIDKVKDNRKNIIITQSLLWGILKIIRFVKIKHNLKSENPYKAI